MNGLAWAERAAGKGLKALPGGKPSADTLRRGGAAPDHVGQRAGRCAAGGLSSAWGDD